MKESEKREQSTTPEGASGSLGFASQASDGTSGKMSDRASDGASDGSQASGGASGGSQAAPQTSGTASDKASELFYDTLFRQKLKKGRLRVVDAPCLEGPIADTHAHIQLLPDPALALARCAVHGVSFVCNVVDIHEDDPAVFASFESYEKKAASLLESRLYGAAGEAPRKSPPLIRTIVGCHPHNAKHYTPQLEDRLRERLGDPRVCAVGEIGLDYHYDFSPRESQKEAFRRQLRVAKELRLPVCLHLREAHDDAFRILQEEGFPPEGAVVHCCSLPWDELSLWVDAGCFIAYGGALTFKAASAARDAAAKVPWNRLLTETDSPYMAPEPMRGMTCEPAHTIFTAQRLAEACDVAPGAERAAFFSQLMQNARTLLDKDRLGGA